MTFYTLVTLFWFLPQTVKENKLMQTKRAMLLYLPVYVLHKQKGLNEIVKKIIAADTAASLKSTGKNRVRVAPSTV